jgi:hypothetical protein
VPVVVMVPACAKVATADAKVATADVVVAKHRE